LGENMKKRENVRQKGREEKLRGGREVGKG
jgi:hypothetical protein